MIGHAVMIAASLSHACAVHASPDPRCEQCAALDPDEAEQDEEVHHHHHEQHQRQQPVGHARALRLSTHGVMAGAAGMHGAVDNMTAYGWLVELPQDQFRSALRSVVGHISEDALEFVRSERRRVLSCGYSQRARLAHERRAREGEGAYKVIGTFVDNIRGLASAHFDSATTEARHAFEADLAALAGEMLGLEPRGT